MDTSILTVRRSRSAWIVTATLVLILAVVVGRAYADFGTQLVPFFLEDGSQVISVNGEPADAVLNRFFDMPNERIICQLMTQYLTPFEEYDIWLEGSNDGTDSFSWWAGRLRATARGNLNGSQIVYMGQPQGPAFGSLLNPRASMNMVVKTTDGVTVQTAYFPAF